VTASELYATWATARGWLGANGEDLPAWWFLDAKDQRAWEEAASRIDHLEEQVDELAHALAREREEANDLRIAIEDIREDVSIARDERDNARYNARVLAHAFRHDAKPPARVVEESLAYPARPVE